MDSSHKWRIRLLALLWALAMPTVSLRASEPAGITVRIATPMPPPDLGPARARAAAAHHAAPASSFSTATSTTGATSNASSVGGRRRAR